MKAGVGSCFAAGSNWEQVVVGFRVPFRPSAMTVERLELKGFAAFGCDGVCPFGCLAFARACSKCEEIW